METDASEALVNRTAEWNLRLSSNQSQGILAVDRRVLDPLLQMKHRRAFEMDTVFPSDLSIVPQEGDLSFWDCLFCLGAGPEAALPYAKAIWPDLVYVEGFVLLSENYDPEYFSRALRDYGPSKLEATINTTYLESLFGAGNAKAEVKEALGQMICESWEAQAKRRFPDREFAAHFDWYSPDDDAGVVLHQVKWPCPKCKVETGRSRGA